MIAATPTCILSARECEVAELVAQGLRNKEIAAALVICENTAKTHVARIMARLNAPNRTVLALRYQALPPEQKMARRRDGGGATRVAFLREREATARHLTEGQRAVLMLARQGMSNQEIAAALALSPATVRMHIINLCTRLGARHRAHLAVMSLPTELDAPCAKPTLRRA